MDVPVDEMPRPLKLKDAKIPQSELKRIRLLGRGTFGTVWRGEWKEENVAIKVCNGTKYEADLNNEAEILQNLHHPSIISFRGISKVEEQAGARPTLLSCLVMELMENGSLDKAIFNLKVNVSHADAIRWAKQIASGIEYMHGLKIVHRDIKPDNILLKDGRHQAKIADFGTSRKLDTNANETPTAEIGTYRYMAPEVLRGEKYNKSCDVFSFGIVLWAMVTRQRPYVGIDNHHVVMRVGNKKLRPPIDDTIPSELAETMKKCWNETARDRPSMTMVGVALDKCSLAEASKIAQLKPDLACAGSNKLASTTSTLAKTASDEKNAIMSLMEFCTKKEWTPKFDYEEQENDPRFLCRITINGKEYRSDTQSTTKQKAKMLSAEVALKKLLG